MSDSLRGRVWKLFREGDLVYGLELLRYPDLIKQVTGSVEITRVYDKTGMFAKIVIQHVGGPHVAISGVFFSTQELHKEGDLVRFQQLTYQLVAYSEQEDVYLAKKLEGV